MHIQLQNHVLCEELKKLAGPNFVNTKQYPEGLSPRIIPHVFPFLPKVSPPSMLLCCPQQVRTVPHSPEPF